MRIRTVMLASSAMLAATAAGAQTADRPSAEVNNGAAPTANTQTAANGAAEDETIVVTGLRRSIQSAQTIKRDSDIVVDSIVAEDIGKLPDVTVSDTAARIVGVQVERSGGEASRVLVRGLPDFTTTYNGREIFTAEARAVALQDFPAGGIAALEVFKTTTANLVEGGLAGEVNVRSRKPFDFNGFQVAGSAWAQYHKRSEKFTPNGNLLVTDRWDTGIGELGALLNVSYQQLKYLDSRRQNTDFIAAPGIGAGGAQVLFPDIQRVFHGQGDRKRPSVNGAVQWRPMDGLEITGEGLWQGFRNKVSDRELTFPLYGAQSFSNIVLRDGSNVLDSLTAVNPNRPDGFQGATYQKTDTFQYALNAAYTSGPLKLSADVTRTRSKFLDSIYSFDTAFANPVTVNAVVDSSGKNGGPAITLPGTDVTSPANYVFRGFFDRQLVAKGDDWQARLDGSYDIGLDWLPKLELGFRYVDRDSHFEDGSRYAPREGDRIPLSGVPGVEYAITDTGFPGNDPSGVRGYLSPTYSSIRSSIDQLRAFVGFAPGTPPADPFATFTGNEKSYAGYAQLRYKFGNDDGIRVDGVIGVRGVKTKLSLLGSSVTNGVYLPVDARQDYTDWLPNGSARIRFTDELQLRLSATKTRTRPTFADYNPGLAVDPPGGCGEQNTTTCIRNARGGNPDLKTLKSNNYDLSLEYYFSRAGSASVAVFRRDLNGFIQRYQQFVTDPQYGLIRVDRPFNTGAGRIDGVEAQVTTFLDFAGLPDWAHGFGAQANVTYLDAKTGFPADFGGTAAGRTPILGVSKWTYNADLFYEANGLAARLSYNRRGAFPSTGSYSNGERSYTERTRPITRLDFSASYDLFKYLTLTFDATNILAKPLKIDETTVFNGGPTVTVPRAVTYEESVYSAGIRFRF